MAKKVIKKAAKRKVVKKAVKKIVKAKKGQVCKFCAFGLFILYTKL